MPSVVWSVRASDDVEAAIEYVATFNRTAAVRLAMRLKAAGDNLDQFPERGRPVGRVRELTVVPPYVLRYRIEGEAVIILRVRHGARRPD